MIRKTFICAAGILAGVSTGAYFDGFFEQENIVTNTYQQISSKFNAPSVDNDGGEGSAIDAPNVSTEKMSTEDSDMTKTAAADAHMPDEKMSKAADAMTSVKDEAKMKHKMSHSMAKGKGKKGESKAGKAEMQKDAKAIALLDLRFSKETYKSPKGGELKYRKLSPRTGGSSRPRPLIVFLHGMGERGDDNVSQLKHGLEFLASREGMKNFPATIIAPQCPKDVLWSTMCQEDNSKGELDPKPTEPMRLTLELINSIQITDNIDTDRIYVTGLSMGGFGTFDIVARRPSTFAAAVPLCGGCDTNPSIVNRFKKTPLWVIHGDKDEVVEVKHSRSMVAALKESGASPRYSELAGFGHNIWDAAYADDEMYKWMFNQSKAGVIDASKGKRKSVATKPAAKKKSGSAKTDKAASKAKTAPKAKPAPEATVAERSKKPSMSLKEAIQSDWQVLAATRRGLRADPATLEKMLVKFEEDSMTIAIGDRSEAAKYKLQKAKNSPYPWIDMISQRDGVKDSAGILAMQGDKLVICWGLPGENRPTTFDSKEGVKTLVLQKK